MLGRSVGNYQLVSKIGEGGMGVVYLARHMTLGRSAAVKVLLPEMSANPDIVARFFNEARAATAVRNPGIVDVLDFGFADERTAYIVMEYLEGESLAARIRRGRSTVMATLTIVRAIARALQAAHQLGIVHRDLKPDNVFLVPDAELPSGERVKLLDFGIAKLASGITETSHTRTGTVMGTPTYMAPEQCRGAGSVDHRADLYALGCIAYQMLCGQPPFIAEGAGEIIARHLYFQPQPLRTHRPDLRAEVEEFVLWLLQKDPGARPSTATDVVQAVDRLAAAAPTVALHSEPMTGAVVASYPAVMDTTLSGAAAMTSTVRPPPNVLGPRAMRIRLIAGATIATAVLLVVIVVVRAHNGRNTDSIASGAVSGSESEVKPSSQATGHVIYTTIGDPAAKPGSNGASPRQAAPVPVEPKPQPATSEAAKPQSPEPSPPNEGAPAHSTVDPPKAPAEEAAKPVRSVEPAVVAADDTSIDAKPTEPAKSLHPAKLAASAKPTEPVKSAEPGKPTVVVKPTDAPKPIDGGKAKPAKPDVCTRGSFAAVYEARSPSETVVQATLSRLQRCKSSMDSAMFTEIQRRLMAK